MGVAKAPLFNRELILKRKEVKTLNEKFLSLTQLPEIYRKLFRRAVKATKRAHCPSSGVAVGAALLVVSGNLRKTISVISGSNFETKSFGAFCCAELAAVVHANNLGHLKNIRAIAIVARGQPTGEIMTPCGICRQALSEVAQEANRDLRVILGIPEGKGVYIYRLSELLPVPFGRKGLKAEGLAPQATSSN